MLKMQSHRRDKNKSKSASNLGSKQHSPQTSQCSAESSPPHGCEHGTPLLSRVRRLLHKALHPGTGHNHRRAAQVTPDGCAEGEVLVEVSVIRVSHSHSHSHSPVPILDESEWEEAEAYMERLLRSHTRRHKKTVQPDKATVELGRVLGEELPYDAVPLRGVLHALRRYQVLDANLLLVAWALVRRVLPLLAADAAASSVARLLLVCIVLAAKAHLDNTVTSALFARLARVPAPWLARAEYAVWGALSFHCLVSPAEYAAAAKELALPI